VGGILLVGWVDFREQVVKQEAQIGTLHRAGFSRLKLKPKDETENSRKKLYSKSFKQQMNVDNINCTTPISTQPGIHFWSQVQN